MKQRKRKINKISLLCLLCTAAAFLFSGCGNGVPVGTEASETTADTTASTELTAPSSVNSTVFSMPFTFSPEAINPYLEHNAMNLPIYSLLYDGLFGVDENGNTVPRLAEQMTVNDLTVTVRLKTGIFFSNGARLIASDVVWSLKCARDTEGSAYARQLSNIADITATDAQTVVITLLRAAGNPAAVLNVPIISAGTGITNSAVGTGRFKPVTSTDGIYLTCNEDWFGKSEEDVFPIRLIQLTDAGAANDSVSDRLVYASVSGNASLVVTDPFSLSSILPITGADAYPVITRQFFYIAFNTSYYAPTAGRELRLAIGRLIDTATLMQEYLPNVCYTGGLFPTEITGEESPAPGQGSKSAAEVLMRRAGYRRNDAGVWADAEGTALTMKLLCVNNSVKAQAADFIARQLTEFGIATTVTLTEDMAATLKVGNYDLALSAFTPAPDYDFGPLLASDGSLNYNGYGTPDLDILLSDFFAQGATQSAKTAQRINQCLLNDLPLIPLGYKVDTVYVDRAFRLGNVKPHCSDVFCNLFDWVAYTD